MAPNTADPGIDFVTLGMFIIDDIYPPPSAPSQEPQINVIGGGGTYSAIGARLFSPSPTSTTVGWIVDAGTDFPPSVRATIESWQTSVLLRQRNAPTTRGWNGYGENDHRAFKYLTEKKRIHGQDLTPTLLTSRSFHLICNPTRCAEIAQQIIEKRKTAGIELPKPIFIWEPVPDVCIPAELENTLAALQYVDVISPNHEELGALMSFKHGDVIDKNAIESQAQKLLAHGVGPEGKGAVVVRASKEGCYVTSNTGKCWLPAYHTNSTKVIDPTGGGNGFLGGLAVGLVRTDFDVVEASKWGSVAASFCIEQVGMPVLTESGTEKNEKWNGENVVERLKVYRDRCTS